MSRRLLIKYIVINKNVPFCFFKIISNKVYEIFEPKKKYIGTCSITSFLYK